MTLSQALASSTQEIFEVTDYDLEATLDSGQAFRWRRVGDGWGGVIGNRWVRLSAGRNFIRAQTTEPVEDWDWLVRYLQLTVNLGEVIASFPADNALQLALRACRGLRLLRQDPWECLASFICSSNKQIVQIRQMVGLLCERYGDPLAVPPGQPHQYSFPAAARLAQLDETDLIGCKLGFRAKYLRETAKQIGSGSVNLNALGRLGVTNAREMLMELPGVGRKIADCVLLFAYGFQDAFPVDVWIAKALRQLYFSSSQVKERELQQFANSHFGPNAGYAQQYLFHYMRTQAREPGSSI